MKKLVYIILFLFPTLLYAQSEAKLIRKGNKEFKNRNYKDAEINYRKSLEKNTKSVKGEFNLGDALYQLEDYENASKLFQDLGKKEIPADQLADVMHNLGNTFLETEKYKESIEAYKNALRKNPTDLDTKYNLEYARKKLKEQEEQQDKNKEQNKDQNKDQDKKDQDKKNQDKEKKDDKKEQDKKDDQQKDQDQKQNDDPNQNEDQKNQQKQQPKQISKKDAERMLAALNKDEKKTIQKLKKEKAKAAKAVKTEKDW